MPIGCTISIGCTLTVGGRSLPVIRHISINRPKPISCLLPTVRPLPIGYSIPVGSTISVGRSKPVGGRSMPFGCHKPIAVVLYPIVILNSQMVVLYPLVVL